MLICRCGEKLRHGEAVYALGYPLKNTAIITEGIVNTPAADINGRSRILTSAQVASGMSGGLCWIRTASWRVSSPVPCGQ